MSTNREYLERTIGPLIRQAIEQGHSDLFFGPDMVHARVAGRVIPLDPDVHVSYDPLELRNLALVLLEEGASHFLESTPSVRNDHLTADPPGLFDDVGDLRKRPDQSRHSHRFSSAEDVLEQKGSVDLAYNFKDARARIKIYKAGGNVHVAMRLIPAHPGTFTQLGLPEPELETLAAAGSGLFLVTGPTGSGKSTTLAALLHHVSNTLPAMVLTIEDPIEYVIPSVRAAVVQREVPRDTPSYEVALEDALRQNPDVIMIGEIRNRETLHAALRLAASGHLVLTSYHAGDTEQAVARIVNSFPASDRAEVANLLSSVLVGILAQKLLPRLDESGRVLAYEHLPVNAATRNYIREGSYAQLRNVQGFTPFARVIDRLYQRKLISAQVHHAHTRGHGTT